MKKISNKKSHWKKLTVAFMFMMTPVMLVGCQSTASIEDNMSEQTNIYFTAKSGDHSASISVGTRENPYIIDGYSQKNCDFSLINVKFSSNLTDNIIAGKITINDKESDVKLDFNPISRSYMVDLGYQLKGEDNVKLVYDGIEFNFENITGNFAVSGEDAIEIAKTQLSKEIASYTNGKTFEGECYLKVLGKADSFDKLFWCFTIEGRDGKTYNIVISVDNANDFQMTK